MTRMGTQRLIRDREIRVFVSSTFRDMQEDRDWLVKQIFPQLRKVCESRGVTWGEVDLRWGITDEEAAEGKVLPLCLAEIRRCRPYFIGLLGERYGWIPKPEEISEQLLEREEWLRDHRNHSVTELEIIHGVLHEELMHRRACFYFRDPGYLDRLPAGRNLADFESESPEAREKLERLKQRIRAAHAVDVCRLREDYQDPQQLGEWILEDFTRLIDEHYPAGEQPEDLDREAAGHEAFAHSRADVYIGRQEYFDRLDAHVAGNSPPLVILGESGSGKSALLANWFLEFRAKHPDDFALIHFIGSTADSADATQLMLRIMLELRRRFELPDDVPVIADQIREAFPKWLTNVAGTGRMVLVLDALNQIDDRDHALDLGWLPRVLPRNVRLIVSTLPGRSLDALRRRNWPELTVEPLTVPERRALIEKFLAQFARRLGSRRVERIAAAGQTENPLFLRAMLDELRQFGEHERLGEMIDHYLAAPDPKDLYQRILERWARDYGEDLVRRSLSLLWAARRGLTQRELLDLLGTGEGTLPQAAWTPFYLAAESALARRSGLLTFFHNYIRNAVQEAFLPGESDQQSAHRRLAEYFQRPLTWTERRLDELPWQLAAAGDCQPLHDVLTNQACFLGLQHRNEYELLGYWLRLKPHFDLATSYTAAFAGWEESECDDVQRRVLATALASFFMIAACHSAAEPLYRRALAIDEKAYGVGHPEVATDLNNLAQVLKATNRLAEAEPLMRRALAIHEHSYGADHPEVAAALNNLAGLLRDTNRLDEAEPLLRRALAILEQSLGARHPLVARESNNLAVFLEATNRWSEAELLLRRALTLDEHFLGTEHPDIGRDLLNLSVLLQNTNRLDEAEPPIRRALAIFEQSLGPEHPLVARALNNLATLLQATNRLAEAEPLIRRALEIDEQSFGSEHTLVAERLHNLAALLQATNRVADAEPLQRRAQAIFEQSLGS